MQIKLMANGQPIWDAVRIGLEKTGIECVDDAKAVACWGWRKGEELKARGHDVLVFERAYLGDRFYYTSIGWNGLNGYADFCLKGDEKAKGDFDLKPWHDGDYIVIMGQVNGDASLKGQNMTGFYEKWAKNAEAYYNMPVFFKPHPNTRRGNFRPKIPTINGSLEDVLSKAHLVLCYNSNSSVDAVLNGVPCITFDKGSMAYEVTGHEVYDRIKPDRKSWLSRLSNCQWAPQEIENGDYVERMIANR